MAEEDYLEEDEDPQHNINVGSNENVVHKRYYRTELLNLISDKLSDNITIEVSKFL